jgi:hypothetical protein
MVAPELPFSEPVKPEGAESGGKSGLASYYGSRSAGVWRLIIRADNSPQIGLFDSWSLELRPETPLSESPSYAAQSWARTSRRERHLMNFRSSGWKTVLTTLILALTSEQLDGIDSLLAARQTALANLPELRRQISIGLYERKLQSLLPTAQVANGNSRGKRRARWESFQLGWPGRAS